MLDIGLDRKKGTQGGFKSGSSTPNRDSPVMVRDVLPGRRSSSSTSPHRTTKKSNDDDSINNSLINHQPHWENSQKAIEAVKRRSPIMMKQEQQQNHKSLSSPSSRRQSSSVLMRGGEDDHPQHDDVRRKLPMMNNNNGTANEEISFSSNNNNAGDDGFNFNALQNINNHQSSLVEASSSSTPPKQNSSHRRLSASTPASLRKQLQEMQHSPINHSNNNSSNSNKKRRGSAGTLNRETISIISTTPDKRDNNSNNSIQHMNQFTKSSPIHFSGARSRGSGHNPFTTTTPTKANKLGTGITTSSDVSFIFVNSQPDPIKEQLRRADALISAIPTKAASPLPSVIDSSQVRGASHQSSAAVLDGLLKRTALLDHDKSKHNKERTASMMFGTHVAALFDLSRSLAVTDPNASEVLRKVHDVLTTNVVKSVEEPLERVSALYDQAKKHAADAREQCIDLRSKLLDCQSEVQGLKRQVRKRDDMIEYLTNAYSLPTVFKDTASENREFVNQTLLEEASPSALLNQKKNAERRRNIATGSSNSNNTSREGSLGRAVKNNNEDENNSNSWYDQSKSLQEQFQVIIPSQEEKMKKR